MTPVPKCKNCGHPPCPRCETSCDLFTHQIICPSCIEPMRAYDDARDKDGSAQECSSCKTSFKLDREEHVEYDTCCEAGCEYDMPKEDVLAWCATELKEIQAAAKLSDGGRMRHPSLTLRYAVAMVMDQTMGYLTEQDTETTVHAEAMVWEYVQDAASKASEMSVKQAIFLKNGGHKNYPSDYTDSQIVEISQHWVEAISDVEEFRSRPDTW